MRENRPQADITYYQKDAVVKREKGREQDGYRIFEVGKKRDAPPPASGSGEEAVKSS